MRCHCFPLGWCTRKSWRRWARNEDTESLAGFEEGPLPDDWIGGLARRGIQAERDLRRDAARVVLATYASGNGKRY